MLTYERCFVFVNTATGAQPWRGVFLQYNFIPARNDPILNNYPKNHWLQMHRANMDLSKAKFDKVRCSILSDQLCD